MVINNSHSGQFSIKGEYSVYSFNKIRTWFTWLYSMVSAMNLKSHSIARKKFLPAAWAVFCILPGVAKSNAQPENSGYGGIARQKLLPCIASFSMQTIRQDLIELYCHKIDQVHQAEKRYTQDIDDLQPGQNLSYQAFIYIKNSSAFPVQYESGKRKRKSIADHSQYQSQQITAREAGTNKKTILAGGALFLIIIVFLLQFYRTKLNNNRSFQALQRELDQKNTFIETLINNQEQLLKEKEWLIKEVQHRVKNNLQVVTSLLYSQSLYLEDGAAIQAIKDSLRRMQAMSLIHQKLYQDNNTNTISMPEYVNDLVKYLHESFDADNHIVFEQAIEPIELDVSQVLPLGLIFTESIVNAIKYAFLKEQQGTVRLSLEHDGPGHLLLKISDNGIGLPAGMDAMEHNSLGLDLIQGLSKQLKGSFRIENKNGVHITVRFAV